MQECFVILWEQRGYPVFSSLYLRAECSHRVMLGRVFRWLQTTAPGEVQNSPGYTVRHLSSTDHFIKNTPLEFPYFIVSGLSIFQDSRNLLLDLHTDTHVLLCRTCNAEQRQLVNTVGESVLLIAGSLSHLLALWGFENAGSKPGAFYAAFEFSGTQVVSFLASSSDKSS